MEYAYGSNVNPNTILFDFAEHWNEYVKFSIAAFERIRRDRAK